MAEPLQLTVTGDGTELIAAVRGDLDLTTAARLRTGLLKCLAEQPRVLLVDLSGMTVSAPSALTVFTAVTRQAATWPGTPVLLCAAPDEVAAGGLGRLAVRPSLDAARAGLADDDVVPPLQVTDDLLPVAGAPRHARNMVTEACARWSLPDLVGPAGVIANELVANGVDHAGSMMTLRISLRSHHLHLALRDDSPVAPQRRDDSAASGLGLVDAMATGWGWLPTEDGKVVWAVIRI